MRHYGILTVITADKHFADLPGITALDPHTAAGILDG